MLWFWGGDQSKKNDKDPTKSLDPSLKEFLDSHQPPPYFPTQTQTPPSAPPAPSLPRAPHPDRSPPEVNAKDASPSLVPQESLFPDGRYAHIWSTYTPQDTITVRNTSPLERIVSARKDRHDLLHRAALENCAFENELQQACLTAGTAAQRAKARLTLCREETKAFNRCYSLQSKFLQALGYLGRSSSSSSSDAEEERIQMHADKLYHRMMDYEAAVDTARRDGTPIPPLSSVFHAGVPAPTIDEMAVPPHIAQKISAQQQLPLADLPPHERELAVRAAVQESKMTHLYTAEMRDYAVEMERERKERQKWMTKYFGEPIGKFVIPDPPPEVKSELDVGKE